MRSADFLTVLRVGMIILVAYMVILKFNPILTIAIFAAALLLDGLDGFAALHEESNGNVGFVEYARYSMGGLQAKRREQIKLLKRRISRHYAYGPRMDVAGDRIVEYSMWALFTFLHVIPLFLILIIIIRHSFADAFMGLKGTSSKLKTRIAQIVYGSNASRAGINMLKFFAFSYLMLVYVWSYPIVYGYILVALLVIYIVARGIAEIVEVFAK
jgi:phosphatidylglycerophosphate synthase